MNRVVVTGAAGELGQHVVHRLAERGMAITALVKEGAAFDVPASSADIEVIGGDVRTRTDVDRAVRTGDAVIHLATDPARRGVDIDGSANVGYACTETETHLIHVSVIGADQSRFPYYRTKARVERQLQAIPGLPLTLQRVAQFHSTIDRFLALPVVPVPGEGIFQPVDPRDLASRIIGLLEAGPSGRVRDFAGPTVMSIDDMAEIRREVVGKAGRTFALPRLNVLREAIDGVFVNPDADAGHRTYRDWLTSRS